MINIKEKNKQNQKLKYPKLTNRKISREIIIRIRTIINHNSVKIITKIFKQTIVNIMKQVIITQIVKLITIKIISQIIIKT